MTSTIHLPQPEDARPRVNPAVPPLIERLKTLSARYTKACEEGEQGYSYFLLRRMENTSMRINEVLNESPPCCYPYKSARHTANCTTVTHAPMLFADPDSGLTACGHLGPIVDGEPTCDTCAGRPAKDGADTYPGVLQPLTARQYEDALDEARGWLTDCGLDVPDEAWRVWNCVNAQYEGGVATFVQAIQPLLSA